MNIIHLIQTKNTFEADEINLSWQQLTILLSGEIGHYQLQLLLVDIIHIRINLYYRCHLKIPHYHHYGLLNANIQKCMVKLITTGPKLYLEF